MVSNEHEEKTSSRVLKVECEIKSAIKHRDQQTMIFGPVIRTWGKKRRRPETT